MAPTNSNNPEEKADVVEPTTDKTASMDKPQSIVSGLVRGGPFYRSFGHQMLGGVLSGLAIRSGINPDATQLVAVILFIVLSSWLSIAGIAFLVIYCILWLVIPMEPFSEEEKNEQAVLGSLRYFRKAAMIIVIVVVAYFIKTRGF